MTVILPFPITVKARLKHIFLVEFDNLFHPNHDVRQDFFIKEEYHYLNVSQVGRFTVYDNLDCTFECLGNPFCLSLNLAAYKGADGTLWCELLSLQKSSGSTRSIKGTIVGIISSLRCTIAVCSLNVHVHVQETTIVGTLDTVTF